MRRFDGQVRTLTELNRKVTDLASTLLTRLTLVRNVEGAGHTDARTFTNTGFLDLDALTGGSGTIAAVVVSVDTGTRALVTMSGNVFNSAGITFLSYRVSGATTIAASTAFSLRNGATTQIGGSSQHLVTGLTPGTNVFELQASVSAGTGTLGAPRLHVQLA